MADKRKLSFTRVVQLYVVCVHTSKIILLSTSPPTTTIIKDMETKRREIFISLRPNIFLAVLALHSPISRLHMPHRNGACKCKRRANNLRGEIVHFLNASTENILYTVHCIVYMNERLLYIFISLLLKENIHLPILAQSMLKTTAAREWRKC